MPSESQLSDTIMTRRNTHKACKYSCMTTFWIRKTFACVDNAIFKDLPKKKDSLTELPCDNSLKLVFTQKYLTNFWLHSPSEYPELSSKAVKYLMPFPTTHVCEGVFSVLVALKLRYQKKLDV
jgi:hypothetical protein